jgi:hypothetical protein
MPRVTVSGVGRGLPFWDLSAVDEETDRVALLAGQTAHIHVAGVAGSTLQIIGYVGSNPTGVAIPYNGTADFTDDFSVDFTAGGKCAIAVKLTVDGTPDLLLESGDGLLLESGFSILKEG